MKILLLITLFFTSVVVADDFTTIDGKEYEDVTISRIEPDGIVLITTFGISKVYFTELPKDIQQRFHYDPAKAAEFRAAMQTAEQQYYEHQAAFAKESQAAEKERLVAKGYIKEQKAESRSSAEIVREAEEQRRENLAKARADYKRGQQQLAREKSAAAALEASEKQRLEAERAAYDKREAEKKLAYEKVLRERAAAQEQEKAEDEREAANRAAAEKQGKGDQVADKVVLGTADLQRLRTKLAELQKEERQKQQEAYGETAGEFHKVRKNHETLRIQISYLKRREAAFEERLAELGDESAKTKVIERQALSDPMRVANSYIDHLARTGVVKNARLVGVLPGIEDAVSVVYALDYVTESGFRREGKYVIALRRNETGEYHIFNEYPAVE